MSTFFLFEIWFHFQSDMIIQTITFWIYQNRSQFLFKNKYFSKILIDYKFPTVKKKKRKINDLMRFIVWLNVMEWNQLLKMNKKVEVCRTHNF